MKWRKLLSESITPSLPNAQSSSQAQSSIGEDKFDKSSERFFCSMSVFEFSKISSSSKFSSLQPTNLNFS